MAGKEMMHQNKKRIIVMITIVIAIFLIYLLFIGGKKYATKRNSEKADELLSHITYTEKNADKEMETIQNFLQSNYLSIKTKGKLYKSLAEISYMNGDDMTYNKYVATALFYLQENEDAEEVVYLTNKYMGRLYANGCYEDAQTLLKNLADKYDISDLPLEMQASYYLSRADLLQMLESTTGEYLKDAQAAILLLPDSKEKRLNQAKCDMLSVRQKILDGQWSEAEEGIKEYSENDSFGYEQDQVYVVCDFKIAYEELMTKITLHSGDVKSAEKYINTYITLCEEYQFRAMELKLLTYVNQQTSMNQSGDAEGYFMKEKQVLQRNLSEITNEYARVLLADMKSTNETLRQEQKDAEQNKGYLLITVIILTLLVTTRTVITILWDYLNRDGLTKLNNRKKYESLRLACSEKKTSYGFLMIDVDDFKKVNDTLGHDQGDVVLKGIAQVLTKYVGRGIFAFRYGGEEMCMMFLHMPQKRVLEIAEEIRETIQDTEFVKGRAITISGGVAMSEQGEDVLVLADQKLYEAKRNGKNKICS